MYEPKVDDYVIWTTQLGMIHEGWVYFVSEEVKPKRGWPTPVRYITIEIGTKPNHIAHLLMIDFIRKFMCCFVVMKRNGQS